MISTLGQDAEFPEGQQVSGLLAGAGHHRGAKPADLVIAAAAEAARLVVLHDDDDYDRIAVVTHQPTE